MFALLNTLNALWLVKLVAMVCRDDQKRRAASRAAESAGAAGGKSDGRPGALSIAADATVSIATLPRAKAD